MELSVAYCAALHRQIDNNGFLADWLKVKGNCWFNSVRWSHR